MIEYPRFALIEGKEYPINTDFKVAIECDRIINDVQIDDKERGAILTGLLFGELSPYTQEALDKATLYLQCGETDLTKSPRVLDFGQHWDLYFSAFKGHYNINLNETEMHYYEFVMLTKGLKNQAINDVVELLLKNPREIKDNKKRRELVDAQNHFKIKQEKPREKESLFMSLLSDEVKGGKHG